MAGLLEFRIIKLPARRAALPIERSARPARQRCTPRTQWSHGTIMVTPPKTPANDGLSPLTRAILISSGLLALGLVVALSLPMGSSSTSGPAPARPEPVLTAENAAELCWRLFEEPKEYMDGDAKRRRWDLRAESCRKAYDADPANPELKVAVARNLPYAQKAEAIAMLREAAAQGSAAAYYEIYEHHRSWDRGDLDKPRLVTRADAAEALRKAAELGHLPAMRTLVGRLENGDIVKRDVVAARYWAERIVAHPERDANQAGDMLSLGSLLASSDKPDERARGVAILERLDAPARYLYGAKRELALAIRKQDPVRARALLEEARRPDPGGALVPLAEMLIAGEGGPADPKRALSMLTGKSDSWFPIVEGASQSWMAKGMLGRLTLEGKLVPRDVPEAVKLLDSASSYDFDARMLVLRLLAEYPETQVRHPKQTLYYAVEAAELDEPGAMKLLIDLKLSANAQFQDRPGACKLIETAASRGDQGLNQNLDQGLDQGLAERLAECRRS
jgi:TPR repeat protein